MGPLGEVVAIEDRFGASAPGEVVMEKYGFTGGQVAEARALRLRSGEGEGAHRGDRPVVA